MVRSGTPRADAAAKSRSRRGASGPTSRSLRSTERLADDRRRVYAELRRSPHSARPRPQHGRSGGALRANMERMEAETAEAPRGGARRDRWWHRGPFVRREVRLSVGTVLVFLFFFYVALPLLADHRSQIGALAHINVAYLALGVLLEVAALVAYTQLTHSVLPHGGPSRRRLFRINLSTLALSHVSPGGTAPGTALGYRLLTQSGVTRCRHRIRPRHPGHRLGGGAERPLLVLAGGVPADPRLPGAGGARPRLDVGLDPPAGGGRRRRGAARRLRRPVLPADPRPGTGQSDHPRGGRPHPLPRRRPVHVARRAAGRTASAC